MRTRWSWTASTLAGLLLLSGVLEAQPAEKAQYCILFGVGAKKFARWDGSITGAGARILKVDGWRLGARDKVDGASWQIPVRAVKLTRALNDRNLWPMLEAGIYVTAELLQPNARFDVETLQGNLSFHATEVPWGRPLRLLDGQVTVERIPLMRELTSNQEEQDYPALAARGDLVHLAYVEFKHGNRDARLPRQLDRKPSTYEILSRPAGGDQVMLKSYAHSTGQWNDPEPVSQPGQDVYKTAVAADGDNRIWVFWSARVGGNFDIYGRFRRGGTWSEIQRVTTAPGPDLTPAAVTDSSGTVWLTWQGHRADRGFDILAARQAGDGIGSEFPVAATEQNEWAPQIAAGANGQVALAWDTYDNGDYDVYLRRLRWAGGSISPAAPIAVAATEKFEARPTLAYDAADRIWIAYEEGYPAWGKDFGAYETTGVALYRGSTVRVKTLTGDALFTTTHPLDDVIAVRPPSNPLNKRSAEQPYPALPDPQMSAARPPNRTGYSPLPSSKGYPRIAAANGKIILTYRTAAGKTWTALGTSWYSNIVWYDGARWRGPVFAGHSDGILDNRPALLPLPAGRLLMVAATDHRFTRGGMFGGSQNPWFNHDLFAHEIDLNGAPAASRSRRAGSRRSRLQDVLTAVEPEKPVRDRPEVASERQQVAMMREYRARPGSDEYRLLRGEFHRHTSVSGDGGGDGDIIDAWRYFLDAADMDWAGCCDHDNGAGREYTWWWAQKMTDAFHLGERFVPMFSYERSVRYPEGHRNVVFAERGVRPLPRLPRMAEDSPPEPAPDTQMLYEYLRFYDGIAAVHTSGTNMGTDWRDSDPDVEPIVEIYQGDRQNYEMPDAPRTNTADDSIGGWRPLGFVNLALEKGYRLGFQASSDHISTHMSYCNLWVTAPTRPAILDAFKKRRVYGATDNILADVRCNGHFMGEEFSLAEAPQLDVKLVGTAPFARVHIIKDGEYVYTAEPAEPQVTFTWRDTQAESGKTSYYYVRGEQTDGEIVWVSPMWITRE